jgi:hypothetical protein
MHLKAKILIYRADNKINFEVTGQKSYICVTNDRYEKERNFRQKKIQL